MLHSTQCDSGRHRDGANCACDWARNFRSFRRSRSVVVLLATAAIFTGASSAEEPTPLSPAPQQQERIQEHRAAAEQSAGIVSRIPHQPVQSRGLAAVGYSTRLRALEIEFRRGGTYRYLDVPRSVYRELLASESKAGFYNKYVKGKYRSVYVRPKKTKAPERTAEQAADRQPAEQREGQ
ncbi:MAG TPA: KTSC domain-containing protein [Chthoniobacterales bacterium]